MKKRLKIITGVYCLILSLIIVTFWPFYQNSQMALFHIIIGQYIILPVMTFILSIFIGKEHLPVKYIWLVPICFSVAKVLCSLATMSLGQYVLTGRAGVPEIAEFIVIIVISSAGLLIGWVIGIVFGRHRKKAVEKDLQ